MRDFLFDTPYWFLGVLVVAGVVAWVSGNARQDKRLRAAGYGLFLLAAALGALSYFVDTDSERVIKRTHEIVKAVETKDKATAQKLLHPRVTISGSNMTKQQIVDVVGTAVDQFGIRGVSIVSLDVQPQPLGDEIIAALAATTGVNIGPYSGNVPSNWSLTWQKTQDGWQLRDITPQKVPGMDTGSLVGRLEGMRK